MRECPRKSVKKTLLTHTHKLKYDAIIKLNQCLGHRKMFSIFFAQQNMSFCLKGAEKEHEAQEKFALQVRKDRILSSKLDLSWLMKC